MIKYFSFFLFAFLLSCHSAQKPLAKKLLKTSIEYEVISKDHYYKCLIVENEFNEKTRKEQTFINRKLHVLEAAEIQLVLEELKINEIPFLDVPSNDRFSSNAKHANLVITQDGQSYQSQAFDHNNPPAKLKQLINTLFKLTNQKP